MKYNNNGGGSNIAGPSNNATYFVISDGTEKIRLAATRDQAIEGEGVTLAPSGGVGGTGHTLAISMSAKAPSPDLRHGLVARYIAINT